MWLSVYHTQDIFLICVCIIYLTILNIILNTCAVGHTLYFFCHYCLKMFCNTRRLLHHPQLTVVQCDISTVTADAVVHPTNSNLDFLGEVGLALSKAGGKELVQEVRELANCNGALPSCDGVWSDVFVV